MKKDNKKETKKETKAETEEVKEERVETCNNDLGSVLEYIDQAREFVEANVEITRFQSEAIYNILNEAIIDKDRIVGIDYGISTYVSNFGLEDRIYEVYSVEPLQDAIELVNRYFSLGFFEAKVVNSYSTPFTCQFVLSVNTRPIARFYKITGREYQRLYNSCTKVHGIRVLPQPLLLMNILYYLCNSYISSASMWEKYYHVIMQMMSEIEENKDNDSNDSGNDTVADSDTLTKDIMHKLRKHGFFIGDYAVRTAIEQSGQQVHRLFNRKGPYEMIANASEIDSIKSILGPGWTFERYEQYLYFAPGHIRCMYKGQHMLTVWVQYETDYDWIPAHGIGTVTTISYFYLLQIMMSITSDSKKSSVELIIMQKLRELWLYKHFHDKKLGAFTVASNDNSPFAVYCTRELKTTLGQKNYIHRWKHATLYEYNPRLRSGHLMNPSDAPNISCGSFLCQKID